MPTAYLAALWLASGTAAFAQTPGDSTWAFVVSVLEFRDKKSYQSFPKKGRRDEAFVRFLREERGVPKDHIVWLKDSKATLSALKTGLRGLLERSRPGDQLYFYYAGHGSREKPGVTFFMPYDASGGDAAKTAWAVPHIVSQIENRFRGDRAFLAADACHSGGLCLQAARAGRRVSFACLASAQSSSASTGEWTFSDALLRGLSGSSLADLDGNGVVTFGELAAHIEEEMAFSAQQLSEASVTGAFSRKTALAAAVKQQSPARAIRPRAPAAQTFALGSTAYAKWDEEWHKVSVTDFKLGLYRISYDGWESYWDEWASADRLSATAPCSPLPCR